MRNKLLIVIALAVSNVSFGEDIILRHNRGIFGYKTVTIGQNAVGHYLSCLDPGKKSCKYGISAKDEEYEDIIRRVDEECSNGSTSGSFQDGRYFVKYIFEIDADKLEIRIYTLKEAQERGYI